MCNECTAHHIIHWGDLLSHVGGKATHTHLWGYTNEARSYIKTELFKVSF